MTPQELYKEINSFGKANANAEILAKTQRFVRGGYMGHGLTTEQITKKINEIVKRQDVTLDIILGAAPLCLRNNMLEEISMIFLMINRFKKDFSHSSFKEIEKFFSVGIDNWIHADILGMYTLPAFMEVGIIKTEDFDEWKISSYKFQRRCVPVTLIKPMKKEKSAARYRDYIEPLMVDKEREVHQGVGWFLREAWKIEAKETEDFLLKWKDTAPRLIFQYACEKMTAAEKARFKKAKKV